MASKFENLTSSNIFLRLPFHTCFFFFFLFFSWKLWTSFRLFFLLQQKYSLRGTWKGVFLVEHFQDSLPVWLFGSSCQLSTSLSRLCCHSHKSFFFFWTEPWLILFWQPSPTGWLHLYTLFFTVNNLARKFGESFTGDPQPSTPHRYGSSERLRSHRVLHLRARRQHDRGAALPPSSPAPLPWSPSSIIAWTRCRHLRWSGHASPIATRREKECLWECGSAPGLWVWWMPATDGGYRASRASPPQMGGGSSWFLGQKKLFQ